MPFRYAAQGKWAIVDGEAPDELGVWSNSFATCVPVFVANRVKKRVAMLHFDHPNALDRDRLGYVFRYLTGTAIDIKVYAGRGMAEWNDHIQRVVGSFGLPVEFVEFNGYGCGIRADGTLLGCGETFAERDSMCRLDAQCDQSSKLGDLRHEFICYQTTIVPGHGAGYV